MENQLGKTIRILRQAKSLKISDVASKSEISVAYLSLLENGERQPSLDVIRRLAATLKVPSEALVVLGFGHGVVSASTKRGKALADAVGDLMKVEARLKALLDKESMDEAKGNSAGTSRRGSRAKRR